MRQCCGCREMPLIRACVAEAHPGEAMFPDERRWVRSPAETTAQTAGAAAHLRGLLDVAPHP